MKSYLLFTAAFAALFAQSAQSATIANWKELNAGSTNSGMTTDSPTVGDGSTNNADNTWIAGRFGTTGSPETVALAVGETLTISGSVVLTGGIGLADQFRFGVFDDGGQFDLNGTTWSNGGWLYEPTDDLWQARTNGAFVSSNSNAVGTGAVQTNTGGAWSAASTIAYNWSISVTRDTATTVDLFASLTGGDNSVNYTATSDDVTSSLSTYTAVGVLLGGNMDSDQAEFSNAQYTVVPEPSSALLAGLAVTFGLLRRRR